MSVRFHEMGGSMVELETQAHDEGLDGLPLL